MTRADTPSTERSYFAAMTPEDMGLWAVGPTRQEALDCATTTEQELMGDWPSEAARSAWVARLIVVKLRGTRAALRVAINRLSHGDIEMPADLLEPTS